MPLGKIIENPTHYIVLLENNDSQEYIKGSEKIPAKKTVQFLNFFIYLHPEHFLVLPVNTPQK